MPSSWGNQPRYGEYEILGAPEGKPHRLGQGSFGKTFEAVRKDSVPGRVLETHVAIKVLNPALLGSESRIFQFIQELQALTEFKHPNLINCLRAGEENGEVYYVMDLCRGGDLDQLVRRYGRLPEKVAALIGWQVAAGLHELERQRMVHRDIKPSNVMLADELAPDLSIQHLALRFEDQDSLCRIVDFGLVDIASNSGEMAQASGGTPMYASPEQIRKQPVDRRSDIYSLGMTLWFLVQGKGPLLDAQGQSVGKAEAYARQTSPEEHDASLPRHLSAEFRAILNRMIAKQPEQRFAKAKELQTHLRRYLDSVGTVEEAGFAVKQMSRPLEEEYVLQGSPRNWRGGKVQLAMHGEIPIRIIVVADPQRQDPSVDVAALTERLCQYGQFSQERGIPEALLPIREVIRTHDILGFTEPYPGQTSLADVLKVRAKNKNPMPFAEAIAVLGPIATALEFLLQRRQETAFLSADEIWVWCEQLAAAPKDAIALSRPMNEWKDFRVAFSMVCLKSPSDEDTNSAASTAQQTTIVGLQSSAWDLHPVPAFARLVYRILNGSEVPTATQFAPNVYVPTVTLTAASNNLLRDLLCRQRPWANVSTIFDQLCINEGIVLQKPSPPPVVDPIDRAPPTSTPGVKGSSHGSSRQGGATTSSHGTAVPLCEVVRPGTVISPYDQREQEVPAVRWVPSGEVLCKFTGKPFRLPPELELLFGRVLEPGRVQSPFVSADSPPQSVPLTEWKGEAGLTCSKTGRRFRLPIAIPLPVGLNPTKKGVVISPYDNVTVVEVDASLWKPGGVVLCPAVNRDFALPPVLPALLAVADPTRPGKLLSPYAPNVRGKPEPIQIKPKDWIAGGTFDCPFSGNRLEVPIEVEQWAAPTAVSDISRRLVENPFRPEEPIVVKPSEWKAGGRVQRPATRQYVVLPDPLPPLAGEVVEPGVVRSPYRGQTVPVPPDEWVAGGRVRCPVHQEDFLLPSKLPEWIPEGSCERLAPGRVRSPYKPNQAETVPPLKWNEGEIIVCSKSKKPFRLPKNLPDLEGKVTPGKPGSVCSPFSPQGQDVPFEEWKEGQPLQCQATNRRFILPAKLEEWIPDGEWVKLVPGRIGFPYPPRGEVQLTPEQWKPGQVLVCPGTRYRFRVPLAAELPPLDFERDAVQFALEKPTCTDAEAAKELKAKHPTATAALVNAVWKRHFLDTLPDRIGAAPPPELIPGRPGVVRSPFGARPEIVVPPEEWVSGTVLTCPETNRRCRLSGELPPLLAKRLEPGPPGFIISPYAPDKPARLHPDEWMAGRLIKCPHTGKPLTMPAIPADWLPEGTLKEDQLGVAISPYGEHRPVPVSGSQWSPGSRIVCGETGRIFLLPAKLPPLIASLVENRPGVVQTPYEVNRTVPVSYRQWKPNNRVKCKATKRDFLLPPTLPEWKKKPFPWKLVARAAMVLGVVIGLWLGVSGGVVGHLVSWAASSWHRPPGTTPPVIVGPTDQHQKQPLQRPIITRSIFKQDGKVDYTTLKIKWKKGLSGPDEPAPVLNSSDLVHRLDDNSTQLRLPAGVYEFTLTDPDNSAIIKSHAMPSLVEFSDATVGQSIGLPASLAGNYLGLLWADAQVGIFLRLVVEERIRSVELQELTIFLSSPNQLSFNVTPNGLPPPEIGYRWKGGPGEKIPTIEDIALESPTSLKFVAPIFYVFSECKFDASKKNRNLNFTPDFPGDDRVKQQKLRNRLYELLQRGVAQSKEDINSSSIYGEDKWSAFRKAGYPIDKSLVRMRAFDELFEGTSYVPLFQSKIKEEDFSGKGVVPMWPLTDFSQIMYRVDATQMNKRVTPGAKDWKISDQPPKD